MVLSFPTAIISPPPFLLDPGKNSPHPQALKPPTRPLGDHNRFSSSSFFNVLDEFLPYLDKGSETLHLRLFFYWTVVSVDACQHPPKATTPPENNWRHSVAASVNWRPVARPYTNIFWTGLAQFFKSEIRCGHLTLESFPLSEKPSPLGPPQSNLPFPPNPTWAGKSNLLPIYLFCFESPPSYEWSPLTS